MSWRAVLWIAFAVVHVGVAILGFLMPSQPMGDVYLVYEPWAKQALAGSEIVGITHPWVYPQLALIPLVLAQGMAWIAGYIVGWAILVTLLNAVGFGLLVGRGTSTGRTVAAWFWLAFLALLGPVGMYRIDAITVPIAVLGCLWLVGRPWLAAVLLAAATWIKVWPAALIGAALIALRRRSAILGGAAVVTALVVVAVVTAGGAGHLLGFVTEQTGRGLQLEAPVSMFYVWRAVFGIEGSFVYYDPEMLTYQATGPQVDPLIAVMTPILALVVFAVVSVGAIKAWRGASFAALFPPLALALVTGLVVFNKVGSPQFAVWFIAPLVLALVIDRRRWWGPAALALAIAGLTQLVYPLLYTGIVTTQPWAVAVLTLRNAATVALFVWTVVRLVRVRVPHLRTELPGPRRRESTSAHV